MSDPVIKGAKRSSSRPAPHSSAPRSSAKSRKLTAQSAKPKPKRAAAEKAPVRKADPAKSSPAAKSSGKSSKPARPAAKQPAAAAKPSKAAPAKPVPAKKGGAKAPAAPSKPAPAARNSAPSKSQPAKGAPTAPAKTSATKTAPAGQKAATTSKAAQRPAAAAPRQPSRDEAAALKAFEHAHKEFTRGNFAAARDRFRTLIEQHAGVSEVAARARTYLNIAETRLRTEAALPRDPDSLYDRGVIELNRGDFVAAQELFERALKRDPDAADTHYALAAARARLGSVESALQALGRAVELKPVLRVRAQADADLSLLRNDPEFERIVFPHTRL